MQCKQSLQNIHNFGLNKSWVNLTWEDNLKWNINMYLQRFVSYEITVVSLNHQRGFGEMLVICSCEICMYLSTLRTPALGPSKGWFQVSRSGDDSVCSLQIATVRLSLWKGDQSLASVNCWPCGYFAVQQSARGAAFPCGASSHAPHHLQRRALFSRLTPVPHPVRCQLQTRYEPLPAQASLAEHGASLISVRHPPSALTSYHRVDWNTFVVKWVIHVIAVPF